ncbi:MAG: hypothetical protein KBD62_36985 [Kofleriaceae bacterium]|nr:hypothetical protein [Kofleriaceae bacterium]
MRFGAVDAYLSLAIEAAANAESAAGYDILTEKDRAQLADAIATLTGIAQRFCGAVEKEREVGRG